MADDEVTPLSVPTTNYGWAKPTVGGDDDAWGGMLNSDLDSIDSVVHGIDIRPSGGAIASATPPGSPTVGTLWFDSVGGQTYVWYDDGNTQQWVIAVNAGASLLPASTMVLGSVKVDGTTIKAAGDGTISTTVVPMGDNRIINGDCRIDQRNNGSSGTATGTYTIDRWWYSATQAAKGTWGRSSGPGSTAIGFPYFLQFTSSSAYASIATDAFRFFQAIEADMISDFAWGTANAQPVTLSFWINSTLTGTFSGSIQNYASTRSYPFAYSVPAANTWTKIAVTIPGDASGVWVMSGNAGSALLWFDLGSGSNNRGPANAWASVSYTGVTGAVSVVATNGAIFNVTGVKLEVGSVATAYNRQSLAKSMADCQRYYEFSAVSKSGWQGSASDFFRSWTTEYAVQKRASPTVTIIMNPTGLGASVGVNTTAGFRASVNLGDTTRLIDMSSWTADAEL